MNLFQLLRLRDTLANVPAFAVDAETRTALVDGIRDLDAEIRMTVRARRFAQETMTRREAADSAFVADLLQQFAGSAVSGPCLGLMS